jgi:glycerol-3-phosphate cytidylyltransferase-like family protein
VLVAPNVDEALLGDDDPNSYALLREIDFTILAVGYDQKPEDVEIRAILDRMGKQNAQIVRLQAHKPDQYKSSLLRT